MCLIYPLSDEHDSFIAEFIHWTIQGAYQPFVCLLLRSEYVQYLFQLLGPNLFILKLKFPKVVLIYRLLPLNPTMQKGVPDKIHKLILIILADFFSHRLHLIQPFDIVSDILILWIIFVYQLNLSYFENVNGVAMGKHRLGVLLLMLVDHLFVPFASHCFEAGVVCCLVSGGLAILWVEGGCREYWWVWRLLWNLV